MRERTEQWEEGEEEEEEAEEEEEEEKEEEEREKGEVKLVGRRDLPPPPQARAPFAVVTDECFCLDKKLPTRRKGPKCGGSLTSR